MSRPDLMYFDGRALRFTLSDEDRCLATYAEHIASLSAGIPQVAAVALDVATQSDNPAEVRGLLAAIELMGSLCNVLAEEILLCQKGAK